MDFDTDIKYETGEFEDLDDEVFNDEIDHEEYLSFMEEFEKAHQVESKPRKPTDTVNQELVDKQKEYIRDQQIIADMGDDLKKKAGELYPKEKGYRSLIMEYFTPELCIQLDKISRLFTYNTKKELMVKQLLKDNNIPFDPLGAGTNRYGILIDGYVVKIAFDDDGKIDNKREFIYSIALQPYVIRTYECSPTGLFSVCEYVLSLTRDDYDNSSNQATMRNILKDIGEKFFLGDVGVTAKNYANWGIRTEDGSLVILDYAYIYSVSYNNFVCSCPDAGLLYYDRNFINLICPCCGKKYDFPQLRKRISKKDQNAEIGNIEEKGYVLTQKYQSKPFDYRFVRGATDKIRAEVLKDAKKEEYKHHKVKAQELNGDNSRKPLSQIVKEMC